MAELSILRNKPEWKELKAVKDNAVYVADFDLFTQPSIGTLVNGIKSLAAMFHKEIFKIPDHLKHKSIHLDNLLLVAL